MAQKIRIKLRAFDQYALDNSAKDIVSTAKRTGSEVKGPIPMPLKMKRFTVNRSPHIDKKSREQFEVRTDCRMIDIENYTPQTVDALKTLDLPSGIDAQIKLMEDVK